jgi:hypothetical protein
MIKDIQVDHKIKKNEVDPKPKWATQSIDVQWINKQLLQD